MKITIRLTATVAAMFIMSAITENVFALNTTLVWDANGSSSGTGGTGTWDTTSALWRLTDTAGALQTYTNTSPSTITASFQGTVGTVTLASDTTINVNTIGFNTTGYVINGASGSKIVLSSGVGATNAIPQIGTGTGTFTINAVLDGTAGLEKGGTATLVLGGANTYTGATGIRGGTLSVSSIGTTGSASSNLGAGASAINMGVNTTASTLLYTGAGETTSRVINISGGDATIQNNGAGELNFTSNQTATATGARTLTLSGSNGGDFSGNISNGAFAISVSKAGAGSWTLSGTNGYTGATSVVAGTLLVNGTTSSSSAVTVTGGSAASAVLGGTGTINGSVSFTTATGGILSAGGTNAVGTLTTGAVTASLASTVRLELGALATSYDILKTSGFTATNFTLNLVNFGGMTFAGGEVFNLFQTQAGSALALSGVFDAVNLPTLTEGLSWDQSALYSNGILSVTAVPEPSTYAMLICGLAVLFTLRLRARRA